MKYIIIDRELEETFIVGDMKVVGGILGRSHRTIEKWFIGNNYRDMGRFIIARRPHIIKSRRTMSPEFLKHRYKKK